MSASSVSVDSEQCNSIQRGAFITLEGIEGAGKSTCVPAMEAMLSLQGLQTLTTREPGGTPLAERIRQLVLGLGEHDKLLEAPTANTEALLMFASRAQHVDTVIRPSLEQGKWVLCDRFTDATLAYQGGARALGLERIESLANWVHADLWPDLTLLFDVSVKTGLARASKRGAKDRIERERANFFERVRESYLRLAARHPQRIRIIDAEQSMEQVARAVRQELRDLVARWGQV